MKLQTLFLLTHFVAAAASAALMVAAVQAGQPTYIAGAAAISLAALALASRYATHRVLVGLQILESAVADHEDAETKRSGIRDFDQSTQRIGMCAASWETVAADTRRQTREVQSMMSLLNRRDRVDEPSSVQLRGILAGLGENLHSHLSQIDRGAAEIEQYTKAITEGVEAQGRAVIKTTTYVEQLSSSIDTVSTSASSAQSSIAETNQAAASALRLVQELMEGIQQAEIESRTCEKKLRGLCDPTQQVSGIVATISDIAARTDLLALNASIESIRAGEHGRGFAIVADEVRKLAEQAAGATREISSLIDSMQIVTQESIRGIVRQREQIETERTRTVSMEQVLQQICSGKESESAHVRRIAESLTQQLQVAQDVVLAVEKISEIAKANRGGAENVCWTIKSLTKTSPQVNSTLERLRSLGNPSPARNDATVDTVTGNLSQGAPLAATTTATSDLATVG